MGVYTYNIRDKHVKYNSCSKFTYCGSITFMGKFHNCLGYMVDMDIGYDVPNIK